MKCSQGKNNMLLNVRNLSVSVVEQKVNTSLLKQVSFSLKQGKCLGLVGESGSGKTLVAKSIMQLLPRCMKIKRTAQIDLEDLDLCKLTERDLCHIRGKKIALIFQDAMAAFNPVKTIGNQISESLLQSYRLGKKDLRNRVTHVLEQVGIKDVERVVGSYAHQLSGGQLQRAMIAMCLAQNPKCLIADEPTTSLDVTIQAQIMSLLVKLKDESGISIIFISHDLALVKQIADDLIVMKDGAVVEKGLAKQVFHSPNHDYTKKLLASMLPIQSSATSKYEKEHMIASKNLCCYYPIRRGLFKRVVGYVKAVDDVSVAVEKGRTLAIVGESGSGKTTFVKSWLNLAPVTSGSVQYIGQGELGKYDCQMVFQDPYSALDPHLMIKDSLLEGIVHRKDICKPKFYRQYASELLKSVGLDDRFLDRYPQQCSGGQRQRVCIARALACKPKCLILDEPTSALDVSVQKKVLDLLIHLQKEMALSYVLVTHNLAVVAYCAHQVAVMASGKVVEYGACKKILESSSHPYTKALIDSVPQC